MSTGRKSKSSNASLELLYLMTDINSSGRELKHAKYACPDSSAFLILQCMKSSA